MPLRKINSYPEQEPFSDIGKIYNVEAQKLSAGIEGENFSYGDDTYQEVAVFSSANPSGNIVAFMHGGGWVNGYKEWVAFMAPALNELGITFVSIGYRLAPNVMWPDGAHDVAKALKWINDNINDHGGDPARLFIGGHSAGGHYASWLAIRDDWQEAVGLDKEFIRGALPVSGVYDFTPGNGMEMKPRFLGDSEVNEIDASPIHTIKRTPPFLITWGDRDLPPLMPQAEKMAQALLDRGGKVETLILSECDHAEASYECGKSNGQWIPKLLKWIDSS
ncbi:MAG: alpha/beta hydrolase [Alphaproteobacteria bacterium]|nr:alpha/beta hydrolase [Alphaproteobacteria bacterium]